MTDLEILLSELPQNRPLYHDSGRWMIWDDEMENVLYQQKVNESFYEFIKRCHKEDNIWHYVNW